MGRIEKVASSKHEATISPAIAQFSKKAIEISVVELPSYLATFPRQWPFPRGDLYHWIGVLNRFDELLARVVTKYGLDEGPQSKPFGRLVLVEDSVSTSLVSNDEEGERKLDQLGLGPEGDRELVESILDFSRLLLEKCGNRSLFSSSERLNAFLNSTSLSLIQCTLRLSLCLAQRYYFRQRSTSSNHFHQRLTGGAYNIELDRVQKLASPFHVRLHSLNLPKELRWKKGRTSLLSLVRQPITMTDIFPAAEIGTAEWKDWGTVRFAYYPRDATAETSGSALNTSSQVQMTPTPLRHRSSEYQSSRLLHTSSVDDSPTPTTQSPAMRQEATRGMKILEIQTSKVLSTSTEELLNENLGDLPKESAYDLLNRLRIAAALAKSPETRRQLLGIRLLALSNLAYIYPEAIFQQKILQQDSDEPKRLQLAYQLSDFVHLGVAGDISASTLNQSFALTCLDALAKHKTRSADVCAALNLNVNHGILMFLVRKTVTELAADDGLVDDIEGDDWRDALFGLLRTLPSSGTRAPETLMPAGLIPMFVDMLNLRTEKARRIYPRVLEFLDNYVHSVRDALATLAAAKGFDAISDLIATETKSAFNMVGEGKGIAEEFKTPSTDYSIPYFQQQAIRWLFKFVNHVMQHNSGGFERLIRNFIDSPPLLSALRLVIENAKTFGSHVWSGSINIMSHFIHNEPTSYAVIAEAGLSKSFLEAVMCKPLEVPEESDGDKKPAKPQNLFNPASTSSDNKNLLDHLSKAPERKGSDGILPSTEAIVGIPLAFGAICLNSTGLELFQSSDALERFFDIFESPVHVKCMKNDSNLLRLLGNSFDELVRHHPALKASVMSSRSAHGRRVGFLGKYKAWESGLGAKLWVEDQDGKESISGGYRDLFGEPDTGKWTTKDTDADGLAVTGYIFPVLKFLGAFFENQAICANFIENGGVEYVLDFAVLQSLPFSFHNNEANHQLAQVLHLMAETKPHLVLPPLLNRTLSALDKLEPFWSNDLGSVGFFSPLTSPLQAFESSPEEVELKRKGTYYAKHLVAVGTLTNILREIYTPPIYPTRPAQQPLPFHQVNLADKYALIAERLGRLHAACVWEEILLQQDMPEALYEVTKLSGFNFDILVEGRETPLVTTADGGSEVGDNAVESHAEDTPTAQGDRPKKSPKVDDPASTQLDKGANVKNIKTLRWLLGTVPTCITGFLHSLGRGLVAKRRVDTYQRQKAAVVAGAIASMVIQQLELKGPNECVSTKDRFSYLIVILSSFSRLIFDSTERAHSQCLTMILVAFKRQNGIQKMKEIADIFLQEVKMLAPLEHSTSSPRDRPARLASAYGGIKIILTFFSEMTSARYVLDSAQTLAMASNDRDRERFDTFLPQQFLVELRMEALPLVKSMWTSDFVETASSSIVKSLIEILRLVLEAEHENNAYRRGDDIPKPQATALKAFAIHPERLGQLVEKGYDESLAREALYRCYNSSSAAEEYCNAQKGVRTPPRSSIPDYDAEAAVTKPGTTSQGDHVSGSRTGNDANPGPSAQSAQDLVDPIASILAEIHAEATEAMETEGDTSSEASPPSTTIAESSAAAASTESKTSEAASAGPPKKRDVVTIDDLDKERDIIRSNLIERCLEVLNVHHDVTFELADLINSASKVENPFNFRREIGETLLHFLASLQMDENFLTGGKKIAAHASLLALLLQEQQFYESTLEPLQDNFYVLLGFVKFPSPTPEKPSDESCPWIGQVLLILEKILAEDASPKAIQWNPPNADTPEDSDAAELGEPLVSLEGKTQLFDALLEVLPRIGKDESLALSVARVLVMLTRERVLATRLGERRNLQRLFVMIKQLSNPSNEKLQNTFMLILRHIVEDEDTIRQIIRNDIITSFDSRPSRQTDTTNFVRQYSHLVIRAPRLFVEVTNELLKLSRYDANQRPQTLVLKNPKKNDGLQSSEETDKPEEAKTEGGKSPRAAKETDQHEPKESKEKHKELKTPIVEHPDGVIHYLLSELLSYRDVDDKESAPVPPAEKTGNRAENIEMATGESSSSSQAPNRESSSKKPEKPQFKAEDHPIYIYRCFLLHCLTELLSSYNRTKVEFINFSRKADPLATTPSKPRSGILNYLLHGLIPIGTMEHDESIPFKKRVNTSGWAMKVIIALCTKTIEYGGRRPVPSQEEEVESDLVFVRKFVLEHALKSYKDASASREPLDSKYARLMCMADLFDKMLSGGSAPDGTPRTSSATRQIAKTMFEKNFVNAFTASIADIDLNFPSSKRVVKYILRPLNKLSQTAVLLSESGSIEAKPNQSDSDEISSASSVSEFSSSREETPDLFRHSTLGMFEPHEEETSSDEDEEDEEMYDDEYDEEMEYEEDMPEHDGEVVSDEDEEEMDERGPIEGLPGDTPMDIEVLIDGDSEDDDDVDDDDEDDEDDDEDEDEDDGDEHLDERIVAGEITGDNDNNSLQDGEDEWESDEGSEEADDELAMMNQLEIELGGGMGQGEHNRPGPPHIENLLRVLEETGASVERLDHEMDHGMDMRDLGEDFVEDDLNEDEDDDEEVDELEEEIDEFDDEHAIYHEYDHDDGDLSNSPWSWDEPVLTQNRVPSRNISSWNFFPGQMASRQGIIPVPDYRTHRTQVAQPRNDDGINPLLRRYDRPHEQPAQRRGPNAEAFSDWVTAMDPNSHAGDAEPMEDVQPTAGATEQPSTEAAAPEAGPSEPVQRVHTIIRGRQLDITGMEIDPEYLEALPEEMREEVILQQLAEQRSQAAVAGEEPSEINPEFLEALPAEIREELLQQEAADRRRREREAARRQAAANGGPHAEDMDPASFIATLEPSLRQTVLADQPDDILASLGPEFVTEARALTGRRLPRFGDPVLEPPPPARQTQETKKPQRRQIVQVVDKAGVATLLRLMFMPLQPNARHHLNDILHNVCQNRQNRSEVISLILLILQDGSADISAVERSFAHLSLRAKTPTSQRTPQSLKRALSLPAPGANHDVTPLIVIQQCLGALSFLTQYNPHIPWFFLTEHEAISALKMKALRKGKAKENKANKFALNSLLSLLDRKAILDSPNCMEQLSGLLSSITHPLTILLRRELDKQEDSENKDTETKPETVTQPQVVDDTQASNPPDTTMAEPAAGMTSDTAGQQEQGEDGNTEGDKASKEDRKKKVRTIDPPVVPEYNLRLVVHILSARECNGRTFRETLSTINNLSSIPGAKEIIGKELVGQAQTLSKSILVDLEELIPHITSAESGTDVQGMALTKFSPASSDQAKLLRVLTALDYLFDPSRDKEKISEAEASEKANTLKALYESVTFGPLWTKLSDCLHAVQRKESMLNVATTLLPLIESLMVVCKNTTLKDVPLFPKQGREFSVSSPPPDSGMEGLFFNFTEDHRKILNELVRQNPRLMSGTFSLLVKNPKVLEFDNKRNYFNRKLHSRGTEARHPHPPLQLSVRRDQVFLDSFKSLYFKTADEMKYGKLSIRFHGEEGVDAGGVSREWFQVLARGMFNPDYALFIPVASDRTTFHPNRLSGVNQEHLMFFKFIGRIIGKALYEENDITDILTENFSVEVEDFGETRVIDLVENGRNIPVTQENKEEYVQHVVEHRLTGSVKEQLDHFLRGFHDIIPADLISIFNEQELELLISGLPEIDVNDWKNNTEYHNYSASSPQIQWFWRAVRSFDKEERAKLLQFVTGTSKVPLNGFRELEGMNGFSKFNIHRDYGSKDRLPSSHTCFNQLDLPEYDSYESLRKCLYTAMTAGSEYFGFA
ncbi:DNA binding protein URE-B1 [Trichophyton equinum CBS 127.97]|uniref:HECT-type E3 ubiquitin transferase n=1 Tax=Trichophyton equinum (strain ATCC MYA-4606 / CBS 127.97) TaxID=559882 RepID=F2PST1_TRIEC|nr:DNA binding protein URE-B1 [Trichophyton equinum CBS 127.97]